MKGGINILTLKKESKKNLIIICVAFAITLSYLILINIKLYNIVENKMIKSFNDLSLLRKNAFLFNIQDRKNTLVKLGNSIYPSLKNDSSNTNLILDLLINSESFNSIFITDTNGNTIFVNGSLSNTSSIDYYATNSKNISTTIQAIKYETQNAILISTPIIDNESIKGAIHGIYIIKDLNNELFKSYFYKDSYELLINSTGNILFKNNNKSEILNSNNLFDFFNIVKFEDNYSIEQLKKDMINKKDIHLKFKFGDNRIFTYITYSGIEDWYMITLTTSTIITKDLATTQNLMLNLFTFIAIISIFTLIIIIRSRQKTLRLIKFSEKKFQNLIDNIQGGVITCVFLPTNNTLKVTFLSDGWTEITGYTLDDINNEFDGNPQNLILPKDRERSKSDYISQTKNKNNYRLQYRIICKDESIIWVIDKGIVYINESGFPENQSIITDVTEIKHQEEKLKLSEERFRISTISSNISIYEFDIISKTYIFFENAEKIFGMNNKSVLEIFNSIKDFKNKQTLKKYLSSIYNLDDYETIIKSNKELIEFGKSNYEARFLHSNGKYIWCRVHKSLINDTYGNPIRIVGSITNIDKDKKKTEKLKLQLQTEPLSGLLNKTFARSKINDILKSSKNDRLHVLMVLDIDNFKGINDTMGHTFGDTVLIDVSNKLKKLLGKDNITARIGGDEFLVFMPNIQSKNIAIEKAKEICYAFRCTYLGEKNDYKISCSIGIVFCYDNSTFEHYFEKADIAMYQAKHKGKDQFEIYDESKKYDYQKTGFTRNTGVTTNSNLSVNERIFELLYSSPDFTGSVNMVLAFLGHYLDVSRVYIFEKYDNNYCKNTFRWFSENISPSLDMLKIYDEDSSFEYSKCFDENGIFIWTNNDNIHPFLREICNLKNIKSMIQVSIVENEVFKGFVGFDECTKERTITNSDKSILVFAARILGTFISKRRSEEDMLNAIKDKVSAMDNLPIAVYVIDKDFSLKYMNKETLLIMKDVSLEDKCYEAFMNKTSQCEECPIKKCYTGIANSELINSFGMNILSSASKIMWADEQMFLICCQNLNKFK